MPDHTHPTDQDHTPDLSAPPDTATVNGVVHATTGGESRDSQRLPHNTEAEQDLLGALLADNGQCEFIIDHLTDQHFYTPLNGLIFAAIRKLHDKGQLANPTTLKSYFAHDPKYAAIDIETYLRELIENATSLSDAPEYAKEIYQCYLRRQLILIAEETIGRARTAQFDKPAEEVIEETEQQLFTLAERGQKTRGLLAFDRVLASTLKATEAAHKSSGSLSGLGTGLTDLNKRLGGLQNSDLIIIAGRPGMGKTAIAASIAFHIATTTLTDETPQYIAFFSLEMTAEQLANRILAAKTRIASDALKQGKINAQQFRDVVRTSQEIEAAPFFIDDTPGISIAQLASRARRLKRKEKLGLIVVDYLQLLTPPMNSRPDNRVQEISEISRGLKSIAKELNVPVVAVSQLSRAVEQREDKQPSLADLRDSGSIEQDADVVLLMYREEYYLENSEPKPRNNDTEENFNKRYDRWKQRLERSHGKAVVIIAKQRHGPTGKVRLSFNGKFTEFSDAIADDHVPEGYGSEHYAPESYVPEAY